MEQRISTEQLRNFAATLKPVAEMFTQAVDTFLRVEREILAYTQEWYHLAYVLGETSAERYALAGYPFGRHTKGKKRWLLEMKREYRQLKTGNKSEAQEQ